MAYCPCQPAGGPTQRGAPQRPHSPCRTAATPSDFQLKVFVFFYILLFKLLQRLAVSTAAERCRLFSVLLLIVSM